MKFEELPLGGKYLYRITMEGDEIDAVAAAYREFMYSNPDALTEHVARVAEWSSETDRPEWIEFNNSNYIANKLVEFHEGTNQAIQNIPEQTGVPPFLNIDIAKRWRLGQIAVALVDEIRGQTILSQAIKEMTDSRGEQSQEEPNTAADTAETSES
jgi:hypothetical protein